MSNPSDRNGTFRSKMDPDQKTRLFKIMYGGEEGTSVKVEIVKKPITIDLSPDEYMVTGKKLGNHKKDS